MKTEEKKYLTPKQAIKKAFLKINPLRSEFDEFKKNLFELLEKIKIVESRAKDESEEHLKNDIRDFLKDTYYRDTNAINTKDKKDLVIHLGKNTNSEVGVIIEAKRPSNKNEMITKDKLNAKALQELVLYFLRERITNNNFNLKHLIITNINEWFIFDARLFEKLFVGNAGFLKDFKNFESNKLSANTTNFFYNELAKPIIESIYDQLEFTYFDLRSYNNKFDETALIPIFKIFSPEHLLKLNFINDSNSLNTAFYNELLHIIGLEEVSENGKKLIQRKKIQNRNAGSLLENVIAEIKESDKLFLHKNIAKNHKDYENILFENALELCITWINRILFLKLLEAQLVSFNDNNSEYKFLNKDIIANYDQLNKLFFAILAKKPNERETEFAKNLNYIPYLNSSLFEQTSIETTLVQIVNLDNDLKMPVISNTVLKDSNGDKIIGLKNTLNYLFEFLDSYNFSSANNGEYIEESIKTIINASVLGLIFEKINGYKDGSFFTPGFVTMYMCRETIRAAVVDKFRELENKDIDNFDEVKNYVYSRNFKKDEIIKFNKIIDSITICDPAVGSGHFLVSALNEMIAIKSELKILTDGNGVLLPIEIFIENDELLILKRDGFIFKYNQFNLESSNIQKAIFHEKQNLIENCLFGVDINPNSVKICQLRLWIELLKNTYYDGKNQLVTLPNIDINIKCGNSLISKFNTNDDLTVTYKKSKEKINEYKIAVATYKNIQDKEQKRIIEKLINSIKDEFKTGISSNDPDITKLIKKQKEYGNFVKERFLDIEENIKLSKAEKLRTEKLSLEIIKLEKKIEEKKINPIYENSFEWRFEFPEVLNEDGTFRGFDVIIGNPPYIKEYGNRAAFEGLRESIHYKGKMDLWYFFVGRGSEIAKQNGKISLIAQNNWTTSSGAANLRKFIANYLKIEQLVDFRDYMVFESASIQTMIMFFENSKTEKEFNFLLKRFKLPNSNLVDVLDLLNDKENEKVEILKSNFKREQFEKSKYLFHNNNKELILDKINRKQNFYLNANSEITNGIHHHHEKIDKKRNEKLNNLYKIGDGIFSLNGIELENLRLTKIENELIKPQYDTRQIQKYLISKKNLDWLIYTRSDISKIDNKTKQPLINSYPNIKSHLDKFVKVITSDNRPYGLHRAREQYFFEGEKIVSLRKCSKSPVFAYSDFDCYVSAAFYIIKSERINLKYLTSLLNSKLIAFWLKNKGKMQGSNYQIDKEPLLEIPIIKLENVTEQQPFIDLVDIILTKKANGQETTIEEAQIDQMVYKLYDLTPEEIKVVEGA